MAIALRGTPTTSGSADTNSSSKLVAVPIGAAIGDLAILIVDQWTSAAERTATATGFNEIPGAHVTRATTGTAGTQTLRMFWKRLTAADTGNYTVTFSGTTWNMVHCVMLSGGLASGDPIEVVNTANATSGYPTTSFTVATLAALINAAATFNANPTGPPTGFTEQQDTNVLHTNTRILVSTGSITASGGTSSETDTIVVAMIAVKPAATGGTTVNGVLAASSSLTGTLVGKRTVNGAAVRTSTLQAAVSGLRRVLATVVGTSGLTATVVGARKVLGTAAAGSTVTAVATGKRKVSGVVGGTSSLVATAGGSRTVVGSASAGSTLTGTGSGSHGVSGVAQTGFQLSAAAAGQRTVVASAAAGSTLQGAAVGVVTGAGTGAAQAGASLTATATGTRTVVGTVSALVALTATASGVVEGGSVTVTGTASAAVTSSAAAAGVRTLAGMMTAGWSLVAAMLSPPPTIGDVPTEGQLTLGDLMDARATHESIMLDTIGVRHPGMTEGAFDPDLGYAPSEPRAEYYHGKATVQAQQISSGTIEPAGGLGTLTMLGYAVKGPVNSTLTGAAPGDIVEVYDSADPRHTGLRLIVRNVESNTFVTARRLVCTLYEPSTP